MVWGVSKVLLLYILSEGIVYSVCDPIYLGEKMSTETLTFEVAVKLGKLICPASFELGESPDLLSVDEISKSLGIHLNSVKRWIAESVFVEYMPIKTFIKDEFSRHDGLEPTEILAFYVFCRLGVKHQGTMSPDSGENALDAPQSV